MEKIKKKIKSNMIALLLISITKASVLDSCVLAVLDSCVLVFG
jgi:hypothetical protein